MQTPSSMLDDVFFRATPVPPRASAQWRRHPGKVSRATRFASFRQRLLQCHGRWRNASRSERRMNIDSVRLCAHSVMMRGIAALFHRADAPFDKWRSPPATDKRGWFPHKSSRPGPFVSGIDICPKHAAHRWQLLEKLRQYFFGFASVAWSGGILPRLLQISVLNRACKCLTRMRVVSARSSELTSASLRKPGTSGSSTRCKLLRWTDARGGKRRRRGNLSHRSHHKSEAVPQLRPASSWPSSELCARWA
jgi:hypothetical protein